MKRSNRLVLLVGVFLAVIAFVGVLVLSSQGGGGGGDGDVPTTKIVVVAKENIPLGTVIDDTMVETKEVEIAGAEADALADVSQAIGQIARQEVLVGGQITGRTISSGAGGVADTIRVPPGLRAMTVEVDQVSGVGTLIKTGDYVDLVARLRIPVAPGSQPDPMWDTSSKLVLQGMQVIGIQLPPVAPPAEGAASPAPGAGLSGRHELVTLAMTAQQVEVVKWLQNPEVQPAYVVDPPAPSISLVLRSPEDFIDENGNPRLPESPCVTAPLPTQSPGASPSPEASPSPAPYRGCETTGGIILSNLISDYSVLHPGLENVEYFVAIVGELQELQEQLGLDLGLPSPSPAP